MEYPSAAAFANRDYFMRKRRATGEPSVPNGCVPVSTGVFATLLAITFSFFKKKRSLLPFSMAAESDYFFLRSFLPFSMAVERNCGDE